MRGVLAQAVQRAHDARLVAEAVAVQHPVHAQRRAGRQAREQARDERAVPGLRALGGVRVLGGEAGVPVAAGPPRVLGHAGVEQAHDDVGAGSGPFEADRLGGEGPGRGAAEEQGLAAQDVVGGGPQALVAEFGGDLAGVGARSQVDDADSVRLRDRLGPARRGGEGGPVRQDLTWADVRLADRLHFHERLSFRRGRTVTRHSRTNLVWPPSGVGLRPTVVSP